MATKNVIKKIIKDGVEYDVYSPQSITVDDTMSDSSENPVQNKVVKGYVDDIVGDIEALLANI